MESRSAALGEFVSAARAFIAWVDDEHATDMRVLHLLLARVQQTLVSLYIPADSGDDDEPADDRPSYNAVRRRLARLPLDSYVIVFDPLDTVETEPVKAALSDDLADIYHDILDGFRYLDAGNVNRAVWQWRLDYYSHWGRHLVHAQCPSGSISQTTATRNRKTPARDVRVACRARAPLVRVLSGRPTRSAGL